MTDTNTRFSLYNTNKTTLEKTSVSNGCIYFVEDTKELFFDFDSKRTEIKDILILETDSERTNILFTPLNKFYFVLETTTLWLYKDGNWYQVSPDMASLYSRNEIDTLLLQKANKQDIPTKLSQLENDLQLDSSGNSSSSSSLAVNPFSYGMSSYFTSEPDNNCWTKADDTFISNAKYYAWLEKIQSGVLSVEGVSVKLHTETYSEYDFAINPTDRTFRLPLLNGDECMTGNDIIEYELPDSTPKEYIAEFNGLVESWMTTDATNQTMRAWNRTTDEIDETRMPTSGAYGFANVWVNKGDTFRITCTKVSIITKVRLLKARGNGSLYYYTGATENTLSEDVEELKSQIGDLSIILDNINGEVL